MTSFVLTPIDILTISIPALLFLIIQGYNLGLYSRILSHRNKSRKGRIPYTDQFPPLSIVLSAHDEAHHLRQLLPLLLEQDYPQFEVIVINDNSTDNTEEVLKQLEDSHPNLYHSFTPSTARYISRKKLSLTLGIKASRYDWLVFTEVDCRPASNQWLRTMARNFTADTDIVLGYSGYAPHKGFRLANLAFNNLLLSLRYLSMALRRHTYMGCGRNLAYRKELFYRNHGFSQQLNLKRGEDDLFINQAATSSNTRVELSAAAATHIVPHNLHEHMTVRHDYHASSRYFKGSQRHVWAFETGVQLLYTIGTLACILIGLLTGRWMVSAALGLLWMVKMLIQCILFCRTAHALGERHSYIFQSFFAYTWLLFEVTLVKSYCLFKGEREFRRNQ